MREWQFNGNLVLAESRESYCLFSQRTLLSNIFTTNKVAQASLTCREGGLERETFNPEYVCDECVRTDCILAGSSIYDDFGYVQDEESNYCYPGDLD